MYLLIAFISLILYGLYITVIKKYLRYKYFKNLGVATCDRFIPFLGDFYNIRQPKYQKNGFIRYLRDIYLKNTSTGVIYISTPFRSGLQVADPRLSDELFQRLGTSLEKSKLFKATAGRIFPHAFIHLPTDDVTKKRRTSYQPAFSYLSLKKYENIYKKVLKEWLVRRQDTKDTQVNMDNELCDITLDIIGMAAYGSNFSDLYVNYLNGGVTKNMKIQKALSDMFVTSFQIVKEFVPYALFQPLLKRRITQRNAELIENTKEIENAITNLVLNREKEWKKLGMPETCLLDMLLQTKEQGLITFEEVISEAILFIFAGHETTARTLTVLFYHVLQNPEILKKIKQEIKEVLLENKENVDMKDIDKYLNYDNLNNLTYITMCIKEALRIDPPATPISYIANESFNLGKYRIEKGEEATPSCELAHHNPEQWHDSMEFIPERFDSSSKYFKTPSGEKRHPLSYIPFASGPRNCIGQNFALNEMKYIVPYLFANFDFELVKDGSFKTDSSFAIPSDNRLPIKMTKINKLYPLQDQ